MDFRASGQSFRTNRWATTAFKVEANKNGSTAISRNRGTAPELEVLERHVEQINQTLQELETQHVAAQKKQNEIQAALEEKYQAAKTTLVMKTLSFVGMSLLAVSPFVSAALPPVGLALFIAGVAITSGVSFYYLYKNTVLIDHYYAIPYILLPYFY